MDEKEQDHVAAFDMLFTTNQLQLMKVLLPCLSPSMQKYFAIYIKYQELQYTISYFRGLPILSAVLNPKKMQTCIHFCLLFCHTATIPKRKCCGSLNRQFPRLKPIRK